MLSFPAERKEVFFRDWRVLGVEYLLIGRLTEEFNGDVSVAYELYDVTNERAVVEERLTAPPAKWRDLAHRISDVVYEAITGVRGAFSTRIVYVLAKNAGTAYARYSWSWRIPTAPAHALCWLRTSPSCRRAGRRTPAASPTSPSRLSDPSSCCRTWPPESGNCCPTFAASTVRQCFPRRAAAWRWCCPGTATRRSM